MMSFATLLMREQPRVNKALHALIEDLPGAVRPVAQYAINAGGKRLRPLLVVLMARALGYEQDDIYPLAGSIELFHVATLIHDDVLDNADLRRGQPAAHHTFGLGKAVLAADALFSRGCKHVADIGEPRLVSCLTDAIVRTTSGEIDEFDLQGCLCESLEQYYAVITGKTAWLLRASAEVGAMRAGAAPEIVACAADYGLNLGIAFQIADDALDFAPSKDTGKPEGGDVREAKFTPPIHYYAQSLTGDEREAFARKFAEQTFSDDDVSRIVGAVRDGGFQARTLALADSYLEQAVTALEKMGPAVTTPSGNKALGILRDAAAYVRNRGK